MAKSLAAVIAFVLFATCTAEPARFRNIRANRFSARQEVGSGNGSPARAPYPPAGLRPDIPFELPTETTTTPPQPDNTYLPPESVPTTTNEPTSTYEPTTTNEPTTTYEPNTTNEPATTDEVLTTTLSPVSETEEPDYLTEDEDDTESVISVAVSYDNDNADTPQRLVYAQSVRPLQARSDKLRVMRAQPIVLDF